MNDKFLGHKYPKFEDELLFHRALYSNWKTQIQLDTKLDFNYSLILRHVSHLI